MDDFRERYFIDLVIEGGAGGVDKAVRDWCDARSLPCLNYPAKWVEHGKGAGPYRNGLMAEFAKRVFKDECVCVAFPGGAGTDSMKKKARELNINVITVAYEQSQGFRESRSDRIY